MYHVTSSVIGQVIKRIDLEQKKTLSTAAVFAPCQVILVSANKLTRYIEPCQLTDDFGGSLEYDHSDWLSKRLVSEKEVANVALTLLPRQHVVRFISSGALIVRCVAGF